MTTKLSKVSHLHRSTTESVCVCWGGGGGGGVRREGVMSRGGSLNVCLIGGRLEGLGLADLSLRCGLRS